MKYLFATLSKAKKLPYGSIRKWADGVYIKESDNKWHQMRGTSIAHEQLKEDNLYHKKDLRDNFVEAVHDYAEHLSKINVHPKNSTPDTDDKFWNKLFDDKNWFEDPGSRKFAEKIRKVVGKFHKDLYDQGFADLKREDSKESANKEWEKDKKEREKKAKNAHKKESITIKSPLLAARADALLSRRKMTFQEAHFGYDGKKLISKKSAENLIGFTVKIGNVVGVLYSYKYYASKGRITRGVLSHFAGTISQLGLITEKGEAFVQNSGELEIMPDPVRKGTAGKIKGTGKIGINEVVFDDYISSLEQVHWNNKFKDVFDEFSSKIGINFHDKVRIHVYGKGGSKRGSSADYSSADKVIRIRPGTFSALAHELGHAIDDKMNGWTGTGCYRIGDIVHDYRKTPQGIREANRLKEDPSHYARWMNKPEEIFARCFETYVAKKCPTWKKLGFAKQEVDDESFAAVKPLFDKLLKDNKVKKSFIAILNELGRLV